MTGRGPGRPQPFAHYDQRRYRTVPVEDGYATWSRTYGELDDRFDVDLVDRSPTLRARIDGARIVDLACGNGRMGRWLAGRGPRAVVGIDRTMAMLVDARRRGLYGALLRGDVVETPLAAGGFDGAVCSMALCHVPELGRFLAEARRLLRTGGWLAVVDFHPVFLFRGIPTHFDHPDTGEAVAIQNHLHAARDFFQLGAPAGLAVREMEERFVDAEWVEHNPRMRAHLGWPVTHLWVYEAT